MHYTHTRTIHTHTHTLHTPTNYTDTHILHAQTTWTHHIHTPHYSHYLSLVVRVFRRGYNINNYRGK